MLAAAEWEEWFDTQPDFVWSPVRTHNEILEDEQALANEYIVAIDLPHIDKPVHVSI